MAVLNDKQKGGHTKMAIAYINKGGLSPEQKMAVIRKAHEMLQKKG